MLFNDHPAPPALGTTMPLAGFENVPMLRPRYELLLAERIAAVSHQRSWDVFGDVFSPVWDQCRDEQGDLIALVVAFVEYVVDAPVDGAARARIAQGVRSCGKSFLYGCDQALSHVDDATDPKQWFPYAMAVARSTVNRQRAKERRQ